MFYRDSSSLSGPADEIPLRLITQNLCIYVNAPCLKLSGVVAVFDGFSGLETETPLFHNSLLPDLIHVNLFDL